MPREITLAERKFLHRLEEYLRRDGRFTDEERAVFSRIKQAVIQPGELVIEQITETATNAKDAMARRVVQQENTWRNNEVKWEKENAQFNQALEQFKAEGGNQTGARLSHNPGPRYRIDRQNPNRPQVEANLAAIDPDEITAIAQQQGLKHKGKTR